MSFWALSQNKIPLTTVRSLISWSFARARRRSQESGELFSQRGARVEQRRLRKVKIETLPVESLVLDPANVRVHSRKNLEAIKGSLARFGQRTPIVVDKNNVVRKGNGTLQAARDLGLKELSVIRIEDLSDAEISAYAIADNRTGELGSWDNGALLKTLDSLKLDAKSLDSLGFEPSDLALLEASTRVMKDLPPEPGAAENAESDEEFEKVDEDIPVDHTCPKCGYSWSGGSVAPAEKAEKQETSG